MSPRALWIAGVGLACSACAPLPQLAPPHQVPEVALPAQWKDAARADPAHPGEVDWAPATPADARLKSDWWTLLGDDRLDALEAQALSGNFDLQAAVARLDLAQAQLGIHAAALQPSVQAGAVADRGRISADRPLASYALPNVSTVQNDLRPALSVNYEFDWLGRIRLDVASARASAEQTAADLENVRLLLTAQVATAYLQLRELDEEIAVVDASVRLQRQVLDLMKLRYAGGASSQSDLAQQAALTASSEAQLELLQLQRAQQEDALATLTGTGAADFRVAAGRLPAALPEVPMALPSALLQRRPDIASAERAVAAANAQIGVARAAYYPQLTLAPTLLGFESTRLSNLVSAPALIWALGLSVSQTVFDAGRTDASVAAARATHAGTVAVYRRTVLTALQETQDALTSLQLLERAGRRQAEAVQSQDTAYRLGLIRYRDGLDNALTLATTEQNQLAAQRVQTQIRGNRFVATVSLVKALGGGWTATGPAP